MKSLQMKHKRIRILRDFGLLVIVETAILLSLSSQAEAFPGSPCFNNSECDGDSRCANNGICCGDVGLSCRACESGTGECTSNICGQCVGDEVCQYFRDSSTGCCKEEVNAELCYTYCNLNGDCNDLFEPGEECEISEQCNTGLCLGGLTNDDAYCCKSDVSITCIACGEGSGDCIEQNYLIYVMAALGILLLLAAIACFISARRAMTEQPRTAGGIDAYGNGAVRVLSPFDDDEEDELQRQQREQEEAEVVVAQFEGDEEKEEEEEAIPAEIVQQRPSI